MKKDSSPRCRLVVVPLTLVGGGDLTSIENQARFVAALLRMPYRTDPALKGVQQPLAQASD